MVFGKIQILLSILIIGAVVATYHYVIDVNPFILLSLFLSLAALYLSAFLSGKQKLLLRLTSFFSFCIVCLFTTGYFISAYFTGDGINHDTLAHLSWSSLEAGFYGIVEYHYWSLFLLICCVAIWSIGIIAGAHTTILKTPVLVIFACIFSVAIHPATTDLTNLYINKFSSKIDTVLKEKMDSGYISAQEIEKARKSIDSPRDVLLIYLESFEKTYTNDTIFPDLAPNTSKLLLQGETYTNALPVWGASHTIAGLVSSQCGIPYSTIGGAMYQHGDGDFYMPGAQCLGDIMQELGYENFYYQGARLSFTRKGAFFRAHGYQEVKGYDELKGNLSTRNYSIWGLHDDIVFDRVLKKIDALKKVSPRKPFLVTMLTLDTHDAFAKNVISYWCKERKLDNYNSGKDHEIQDSVYCSDRLLDHFISNVQTRWVDSIDIYIISDHIAPAHSQGDKLRSMDQKRRELIFSKINPKMATTNNRVISHFDIPATILDDVSGGSIQRLGLGVSANSDQETLLERLGVDSLNRKLRSSITALAEIFWIYPSFRDNPIYLSAKENNLKIGKDYFPFPISLVLNEDGEILDFYSARIKNFFALIKDSPRIIYIDKCMETKDYVSNTLPKESICIIIGNLGSTEIYSAQVVGDVVLQYDDYSNYLNRPTDNNLYNSRLYNFPHPDSSYAFSTGSSSVEPMAKILFVAGITTNVNMVTNYYYPTIFDKSRNYQNFGSAVSDGLFLFGIKKGRVTHLESWDSCEQPEDSEHINHYLRSTEIVDFILMTGKQGKCGTQLDDYFRNSMFEEDIVNLVTSEPYIGYLNTKSGQHISLKAPNNKNVLFTLVSNKIYAKYFN